MAKNYDLFLERMKQKYNMPQTTAKTTNTLQYNTQTQNQYYNPAQAEQPLEEKKQGLNWWDKFGAGYQQARDTFATSFLDLGEGLIDSLAMPIAAIADWAGNERVEKNVNRFIEKEWLSALPQSDFWQDAHNVLGFDFLWSDEAKQVARNKEALPEIGEQLASGIGSAVGFAALNAIPYVGPVVAGMASGGSAAEQALQEGSSSGKALGYGLLKGGLESALEFGVGKGLGKLGAGTGKIAGLGKGASTTMGKAVGKSAATKIATKLGQNFVEEGLEEVLSEVADPFLKKLTYKQDEDLKELIGESHDPEHLLETFFVSGLTGAIFEGGQITTSIATSGGIKSWDIRQEADTLKEINNKMEEAILKGDELELKKLEKQKEITIKKVEKKFDNYVEYLNSQKDTTSDKRYSKLATSTLQYAEQQVKTKEVLTKEVAQKLFTNKKGESVVDIKSAPADSKGSYYDPKTNTMYLDEQGLSSLNNVLETIVHEAGHAIHTGSLNTNFINQMTQDFNDFDSLVNEQYKGKVKSINDLISYYEDVKGYRKELENSELLKDTMNENKISKEQAYEELKNDYMLEEIANDIFSKKYFSNLDELRMVVAANKPSFVQKIKDAYRKRFTNSKNKPSNYKEVMQIFKDGIDQNYQSFKKHLTAQEEAKRKQDKRSKLDTISEEEVENITDSEGNKLTEEQIEYFKNSAIRDKNGNLLVVYHTAPASAAGFTVFDANQGNEHYRYKGYYVNFFSDDYNMSSSYARDKKSRPTNPVDFNPYINAEVVQDYVSDLLDDASEEEITNYSKEQIEEKINKLQKLVNFFDKDTKLEFTNNANFEYYKDGKTGNEGFSPVSGELLFVESNRPKKGVKIIPSDNLFEKYYEANWFSTKDGPENMFNVGFSLENNIDYDNFINFLADFGDFHEPYKNVGAIYSTYINIEKPLIVEGNGTNWNKITLEELSNEHNKEIQSFIDEYLKIGMVFVSSNRTHTNYERLLNDFVKIIPKTPIGMFNFKYKDGYFFINFQNHVWSSTILPSADNYKKIETIISKYDEYYKNGYNEGDSLYKAIENVGKFSEEGILIFKNLDIEDFQKNYNSQKPVKQSAKDIIEEFKTLRSDIIDNIKAIGSKINSCKKYEFTTNDIVKWAMKQGDKYDGVVFKNIKDYGAAGKGNEPHDVYVTIKSPNQIKDIRNTKPTRNKDIRFKLEGDIKSASEIRQQLDSQKEKLSQNKIDEKRYQTYLRLLKPEIKKAFDYLESKNGNLTYNESKEAQEFSQIVKDFGIEGFDFDKFPKVSAYDTLKEALKPQREKPEIDENKKIVVSKLKSTPKNAYNSFDKLLEKYGDVYSVFDYYSGEYHLEKWELSFLNEALYQNGRYDEQSKQDIIEYLKIGNLDPYLEYQRYLNEGIYSETTVDQPKKLELDEEQKSINERKEYDFTKLNKPTLMDTALEISKKMQEIYNGTTGKDVNPKYGIVNLLNAQISKTVTTEERNFAQDLYKTRYELLEYYSKKLKELFKQIKKQKSDLNMTSGEITKFESDFKINKIDNGYGVSSEMYKNLTKPSSEKLAENISEIGEFTTEQVNENKLKAFNKAKKSHKEEIQNLINEYGLLNQEQEQSQMLLEKQINDLTIDNYKDKSGEIKLAIQKFGEKIKNNKIIKHQAKLAKGEFTRTRDILLERFPLEKNNVESQLKELNQSIETITYENYEDQKVLSNVKKKLETFENAIKKNYNQAQKIINDFKTSNANLSITADDIKTLKKRNDKTLKDKGISLQDKITSTTEVLEQMQSKENEINQKISDLIELSNKPENKNYRSYLQDEIHNYEKFLEENYFTKIREVEATLKKLEQQKQDIINEIEVSKKEAEEKTTEIKEELEKSFEKFEEYETESETKLKEEIKETINSIDFEEIKTKEDVKKVKQTIEETKKKIENYNNNLEKSIKDFEDFQKTKEEKISKIKETQKQTSKKTKQVIEEVRTIKSNRVKVKKDTQYVEVESAKTIKGKADITKMKKYKKQTCSDLIDVVGDMLSLVGAENDIQVRVQFTKDGKEIAIQEMFEAFNNGELTDEQLKEMLVEILSRGLELKLPDYEEKNGKYYYRKRETFSNINSESLVGTPIKDTILKRLNEIVEQTIKNEGSSTILANKILEHTLELQKAVQEHQKILADLIEEHNKEIEKLTKEKNIQNLEDAKNFEKTIEKVNKRIDKLEQEISMVSDKNTNLKEKVNNSKQELKKLKSEALQNARKLDKETKKRIAAETNLEGVFSFVKADGDFVNRLIEALGVKEKITTENIYEKVAKLYNEGNIDGAIEEIINFVKDKKISKEVEVENENGSKTTTTEERIFTEVYSEETIKQLKEEMKSTILDRINKGQRFAELPLAYKKLADLKQKIKVEKTTNNLLKKIKKQFTSLKKLANNKRKSIFQNNIDKRFKGVVEKLENYSTASMMSGEFRQTLLEFKKFLTEESFDGQTFEQLTGLQFPQELFNQLNELELKDGQVSIKELELYNKILGALKTFIENGTGQRLIDIDGEKKTLQEHVEDAISEQNVLINKLGKENFSKILQTVDPRVVFKIASGFNENSKFYKLFEELQRGDTQAMAKEMELKTDLEMFFKQHRGYKKSLKKKVSITGIEASVGEFISLYKLIRRPDAYKHITKYGIEIGETRIKYQGTEEEVKLQVAKLKSAIEQSLELKKDGSLNKQFFDKTVEFFKAAADAKEYIDERLYGYSNVLRKDENGHDVEYFPIRISSIDFNKTLGDKQFSTKMSASLDYSWNKSVTGRGGVVKVENVNDIISQHARQVAQYYGYALPLDKFNQIYSFKIADRSGTPTNLRETLNSRFGKSKLTNQYAMEDYLRVLFDDIRGNGSNGGELDKTFNKIFGSIRRKYSTYVLGANLKVAGVQLAAIPAVYKYASLKSMLKASKKFSKEMTKEYELPALGKYRTYDKSILKSETLNDNVGKVADAFGKLMSITDNLTIQYAWKVALYETANKNGTFDKAKAEKLFEKIVRETQPQYSAIERSALMRSKNELVKMLTQFKAQANKNFSALVEMWYKARYYKKLGKKMTAEDKKIMVKTPISIAAQSSVAIFMSYLFKHIVNDLDEDEFSVLGFIENFFNELVGIIPLINNFKIDLQGDGKYLGGYLNVYEMNLGGISKLQEAFTGLFELFDDEKNTAEKVYDSVNAIGIALGIPTENIYKLVMGLHKRFIPEKAIYWDEVHKGLVITNKTKVNEAIEKEQYELAETYYKEYTKTILELDDHTTKIMFNLYKDGYENCYLKQIPKTLIVDNEEVKVDREQFLKTYSKLVPKLKLLVRSTSFRRLTKEEQEKVISKLINLYYSLAKKDCIEDYDYTELETMILYYNNFNVNNLVYLAHINELKSSENETKKEKVQRYINSLRLPAGEKYLLYYLSGYKLSERNQLILKSFLSSKGLPKSYIKVLFN